jgi:hypothetical protein
MPTCKGCNEERDIYRDGLCRPCRLARERQYAAAVKVRVCKGCGETKETVYGRPYCKTCYQAKQTEKRKKRRESDPEKVRAKERAWRASRRAADPEGYKAKERERHKGNGKSRYYPGYYNDRPARRDQIREIMWKKQGINVEQARAVWGKEKKCAICGTSDGKLCVDHNHTTGEVRGMLCNNCNMAVGFFQDSPLLLKQAIQYLQGEV